ncbi:MAG: glucosamine-6-phosphate deaminase [Alphaproteobacteria bacterium]|nr:MAG: glucosamine-6-phosphate deaminase [Alphaproteobacteria bacterium]
MGRAAAQDIASSIKTFLTNQPVVRIIFAAAPSQADVLENLTTEEDIDWSRVVAFHMDEYIGLPPESSQRFGNWLKVRIFDRLPFNRVHIISPEENPKNSANKYSKLLNEAPIDIICLGIGTNGHLAFNDPLDTDFADSEDVKVVPLDAINRRQQVDDGCFKNLNSVPKTAITLTIPMLMSAKKMFCVVPGEAKRQAVWRTLNDPITPSCPSTTLRTHSGCNFYVDNGSNPER